VSKLQVLRLFSILTAILVGGTLPLYLIGIQLPNGVELFFDILVPIASANNIYLHFKSREKKLWRFKSWIHLGLWADLICLVPFSLIVALWTGQRYASLVFINLMVTRHIGRIKSFLDAFGNLKPVLYRLVPLALTTPLLVHLVACGWISLGSGSAGPDLDRTFEYVKALYWSFSTLTTVGYGDITAKTPVQMFYASLIQVIGVGMFGYVLSNVTSLLSRIDAAREHHMDSLDRIETFMHSHRIPTSLRGSIRSYYHYLWTNHKGYRDKTLIRDLPPKIQSELLFYINKSIIEKVPFFKGANQELIEDLMTQLEPKIIVPGERIFRVDEPGSALYFIHSGEVEILARDGSRVVILGEGSFFGEMALLSDRLRNATARALSYTDLYILPKESFFRTIAAYPEFRKHIEDVVKTRQA
jgi:voltage-gated potassium channel